MTLEKAIEILDMAIPDPDSVTALDMIAAMQLGIEALKLVNAMGECPYCHIGFTLPGETKK